MFSSLNKRRLLSLGLSLAILSGCTSVDLGESEEPQEGEKGSAEATELCRVG